MKNRNKDAIFKYIRNKSCTNSWLVMVKNKHEKKIIQKIIKTVYLASYDVHKYRVQL